MDNIWKDAVCRSEKRRTDCFDERQSVRFYFMRIGETKSKAEQSGKHRGLNKIMFGGTIMLFVIY